MKNFFLITILLIVSLVNFAASNEANSNLQSQSIDSELLAMIQLEQGTEFNSIFLTQENGVQQDKVENEQRIVCQAACLGIWLGCTYGCSGDAICQDGCNFVYEGCLLICGSK